MNDGVEGNQFPSQNSLLYLVLTNEINLEDSSFSTDHKDLSDEESNEIYQIRRRYTLENSDVNAVRNRCRSTAINKANIISEDLLEQTRESFDKLSTETCTTLSPGTSKNIHSTKRRLGILLPSPIFPYRKQIPYSTKRKRNNDISRYNLSTESGLFPEDLDQSTLGHYGLDNGGVGRKRSYTLPQFSLSNLNQSQNEYLRSSSKAVLSPKCANLILKFVVEELKKISSFILKNRDLFKIPLPDLKKIIVRLLLLEIADKNLYFSVIICHLNKKEKYFSDKSQLLVDYETKIPLDINLTKSEENVNYVNPKSIVNDKDFSKNSYKMDIILQPEISTDFPTKNKLSLASNNSLNHVDNSTNSSQISENILSKNPILESMDSALNLSQNNIVKQDNTNINLNSSVANDIYPENPKSNISIIVDNQYNKDADLEIDLSDTSLPTLKFTEMVRRLITRYQGFCVSRNEHNQLKLAILHMNGELSSVTQKKLQELVASEFPNDPLRYSKLLLSLYSLCSIDVDMATKFFCPNTLDVTTFVMQEIKG